MQTLRWTGIALALGVLVACAARPAAPQQVPAPLRVPEDQTLFLVAAASGVQIYQCTQKADGSFEWTFKAPEAALSFAADGTTLVATVPCSHALYLVARTM